MSVYRINYSGEKRKPKKNCENDLSEPHLYRKKITNDLTQFVRNNDMAS